MPKQNMDVRFPLAPPPGYVSRHVQVRFDPSHAQLFSELHHGLVATGAKLADGKPVSKLADTIRYLTEVAHAHGEAI